MQIGPHTSGSFFILMSRFIGDRKFYKSVFAIALPIMLQNGVSSFVNMLDNLMVGRIGTEQLSGVSIVNDLMFVYQLCLFGAISGAGIFTAQMPTWCAIRCRKASIMWGVAAAPTASWLTV